MLNSHTDNATSTSEKKILIVKKIQSNQTNKLNEPMINLLKGDVLEIKNGKAFFTREIDFSNNTNQFTNLLEFIDKNN